MNTKSLIMFRRKLDNQHKFGIPYCHASSLNYWRVWSFFYTYSIMTALVVRNKNSKNYQCVVYWDYENCPIPDPLTVKEIKQYLHGELHTLLGINRNCISIKCYTPLSNRYIHISDTAHQAMSHHGIKRIIVPNEKPEAIDKRIIADIGIDLCESVGKCIISIALISGDSDYSYILSRAHRQSHVNKVILFVFDRHQRVKRELLQSVASIHFFPGLPESLERKIQSHRNAPSYNDQNDEHKLNDISPPNLNHQQHPDPEPSLDPDPVPKPLRHSSPEPDEDPESSTEEDEDESKDDVSDDPEQDPFDGEFDLVSEAAGVLSIKLLAQEPMHNGKLFLYYDALQKCGKLHFFTGEIESSFKIILSWPRYSRIKMSADPTPHFWIYNHDGEKEYFFNFIHTPSRTKTAQEFATAIENILSFSMYNL